MSMFSFLTKWTAILSFFLIPIFFLPWTTGVLEQNKQALLVVLVSVALVAWFGQMVATKYVAVKSGWMHLLPLLFLLSVLVSAIFSLAGYQSWVGNSSQEYTSFLSIALFVAMFYVFSNSVNSLRTQTQILFGLLLSATIAGVVTTLGMFNLVHLPFAFAKSLSFNTIGTLNGYIIFLTTAMFMGLAMWLVSARGQDRILPEGGMGVAMRVFTVMIVITNLVALVSVDYWVFWVMNIFGVLLLALFGFLQSDEFPSPKQFAIPLLLFLVSILFLFLPSPLSLNLPVTVSPSFATSWQIATSTLGSSARELFFGSGPGTYLADFLRFKPVGINASQFWSIHLDRSKSAFLTTLTMLGLIGTSLWILFIGWLGSKTVRRLIVDKDTASWKMTYVLFVGWAMLLLAHFLHASHFTLEFLFWGLSGLLASHLAVKQWSADFSRSPKMGLAAAFVFILVGVGVIASLFVTTERYLAELAFQKAITLDQKGTVDPQLVIDQLAKAIKHNGSNDIYYRNLSSAFLIQAGKKIGAASGGKLSEEQSKEVNAIVTAAVNAATKATQIEPNDVANWIVLGSVYRNLMPYAQNAEDLAAQAFLNTVRLEPANPSHRTELGRVYLAVADRMRTFRDSKNPEEVKQAAEQEVKLLATAEQAFNSAIQLKNDYLPAHYYLAATYERQNKMVEAANRLIALTKNAPTDVGLGFELSQLFLRMEKHDLAKAELERIIAVNPKYSNALWYLASVYEIQKDHQKAIEIIKQVVELNPGNKVALERLQNLENGKATTQLPEPIKEAAETTEGAEIEIKDVVVEKEAS